MQRPAVEQTFGAWAPHISPPVWAVTMVKSGIVNNWDPHWTNMKDCKGWLIVYFWDILTSHFDIFIRSSDSSTEDAPEQDTVHESSTCKTWTASNVQYSPPSLDSHFLSISTQILLYTEYSAQPPLFQHPHQSGPANSIISILCLAQSKTQNLFVYCAHCLIHYRQRNYALI